jgi:hypothetical protein
MPGRSLVPDSPSIPGVTFVNKFVHPCRTFAMVGRSAERGGAGLAAVAAGRDLVRAQEAERSFAAWVWVQQGELQH